MPTCQLVGIGLGVCEAVEWQHQRKAKHAREWRVPALSRTGGHSGDH
jgi:hypothetical protein